MFKHIKLKNVDFTLLENDLRLLKNSTNNKFSNKRIQIKKSTVIFKNNLDEIISIIKISDAFLFHNDEDLLNLFKLQGDVFNVPFNFNYNKNFNFLKSEEINVVAKKLKLKFFNIHNSEEDNSNDKGKNIISFLNSKINTSYKIENDIIKFESTDSKLTNSKVNYNGELAIDPFELNLNIDWDNYNILNFFNPDSILNVLIKTKLLFNSIKT
jgi:hypothetical protein